MPEVKFRVEGYFIVIIFPYLPSSLWVLQKGSCISGKVRCCLLKCYLYYEVLREAACTSESTYMGEGQDLPSLVKHSQGLPLTCVASKIWNGLFTGFGGRDCLL